MTKENKLILSTKKSIHAPLKIEIDGKTYENNPLSRALFDELKKHEDAALGGDIEALYAQVRILYSVPIEILNELDVRDIRSLLEFTMSKIFASSEGAKTEEEKTEKKDKGPGIETRDDSGGVPGAVPGRGAAKPRPA